MRHNFLSAGFIISHFQVVKVNCSSAASITGRWESHWGSDSVSEESQSALRPFAEVRFTRRPSRVLVQRPYRSWYLQAFESLEFLRQSLHLLLHHGRCCSSTLDAHRVVRNAPEPPKTKANYTEEIPACTDRARVSECAVIKGAGLFIGRLSMKADGSLSSHVFHLCCCGCMVTTLLYSRSNM